MKKLLLLAVLSTGLSSWSPAQTVDLQRAKEIATSLQSAPGQGSPNLQKAKSLEQLQLAYKATDEELTYYYVFNYPSGGFAIIGGDKAAREVLGYCDSGSFDINKIPDGLKDMLSSYKQQIKLAKQHGLYESNLDNDLQDFAKSPSRTTVAPLIQTRWNQRNPYNSRVPKPSPGVEFPSGCVATALAQIMKYYNYPNHGYGNHAYQRYYNVSGNYTAITFEADFEHTYYDWNDMLLNYSGNYNTEQAYAVGTLMYHVGVSVDMQYEPSGSGAYSSDAGQALIDHFGYNPEAVFIERRHYDDFNWERLIYQELSESRPVYYSGQTYNVGHAFICDGYDANNGLYHFNWGWGGSCDGYYPITGSNALNPGNSDGGYIYWQAAWLDLKPSNSSPNTIYVSDILLTPNTLKINEGETSSVDAEILPSNATYKQITWKSSNTSVAVVSADGSVTAKSSGTATITASSTDGSNITATCHVTVESDDPTSYDFSKDGIYYRILSSTGKTCEVTYRDKNYNSYSGKIQIPETVKNGSTTYTVKGISSNAFRNCSSLTSVNIPNSVNTIGDHAFNFCRSLTSVSLPSSVNRIEESAFASCQSLTAISLPKGIDEIAEETFYDCRSLLSIELPSSIEIIGPRAFGFCSSLITISLPEKVSTISVEAFSGCGSLRSVSIPSSVTKISRQAFSQCYSLTSVVNMSKIPQSISSGTFETYGTLHVCQGCGESYLSASYWSNFTIEEDADKTGDYDFVHDGIYYNITSSTNKTCEVTFKDKQYNTYTGKVSIPSTVSHGSTTYTVTGIGDYAFYNCSSLKKVSIPQSVRSIGSHAFTYCTILSTINIPNTVSSIAESAFASCHSITSFDIPDGITQIYEETFYDCQSLASITIPESVRGIGPRAFGKCTAFTSVIIPEGVGLIGSGAFVQCQNLSRVSIPNTVYSISDLVFDECHSLSSVTNFATTPQSIFSTTFAKYGTLHVLPGYKQTYNSVPYWTNFEIIEDAHKSDFYDFSYDGIYYRILSFDDHTCEVAARDGEYKSYQGEIIIPSRVTYNSDPYQVVGIASKAFYNCPDLTHLSMPSSIKTIGDHAFTYCTLLESISIPNSVTAIGESAFASCNSLSSINLPSGITRIEEETFYGCSSLKSLTIPENVTIIGPRAFGYCISFDNVEIPDGVTELSVGAYQGCSGLTQVVIPASVKTIGKIVFENCFDLNSVTNFSSTPQTILEGTFGTYGTLHVLPGAKSAYAAAKYWQNFSIEEDAGENAYDFSVDGIYYSIVSASDQLCEVTFRNEDYASYSGNLIIPSEVTYNSKTYKVVGVGQKAFFYCLALSAVSLPESIKTIGDNAFKFCKTLSTIEIPSGVTEIGECAFSDCSSLRSVSLPEGLTEIAQETFYNCGSLGTISVPSTVTAICTRAFGYCTSLSSITIPENVNTIQNGAFQGCSSLWNVYNYAHAPQSINETVFNVYGSLYLLHDYRKAFEVEEHWNEFNIQDVLFTIKIENEDYQCAVGEAIGIIYQYDGLNQNLNWASSDNSVVSVSANGSIVTVSGLRNGSATITAMATDGSGARAIAEVHVGVGYKIIEQITLSHVEAVLEVGETLSLIPSIYPEDAENKEVHWSSSDETVAIVSADGAVTAVGLGEATITVSTTDDSNLSATCVVTVVSTMVEDIVLPIDSLKLRIGDVYYLEATVLPENSTNRDILWSSSDEDVAVVSSLGKIVALSEGQTFITASAADGSGVTASLYLEVYIEDNAISNVTMPTMMVFVNNGDIIVKGLESGAKVDLYNLSGALIGRAVVKDGDAVFKSVSPTENALLVRTGGLTKKILINK